MRGHLSPQACHRGLDSFHRCVRLKRLTGHKGRGDGGVKGTGRRGGASGRTLRTEDNGEHPPRWWNIEAESLQAGGKKPGILLRLHDLQGIWEAAGRRV